MNRRTRTTEMIKLLNDSEKCELCGCRRGLEVHHIIPVVYGGPEDDVNNMIVLCSSCHTKLTPKTLLIKHGMEEVLLEQMPFKIYSDFYYEANEFFNKDCKDYMPCMTDVFDLFDSVIDREALSYYKRKGKEKWYISSDFHKDLVRNYSHLSENKDKNDEQIKRPMYEQIAMEL